MPTPEQLQAGKKVVMAVAETIREVGSCPSGTLYAGLMGMVSFEGYSKIIRMLTNAGLIEVDRSHMVKWTGRKF